MQREAFRRPKERAPSLALRPSFKEDFRQVQEQVVFELRDVKSGEVQVNGDTEVRASYASR